MTSDLARILDSNFDQRPIRDGHKEEGSQQTSNLLKNLKSAIRPEDGRKTRRGRGPKRSLFSKGSKYGATRRIIPPSKQIPPPPPQPRQNPMTALMLASEFQQQPRTRFIRDTRRMIGEPAPVPVPVPVAVPVSMQQQPRQPNNEQITRTSLNRLGDLVPGCDPRTDSATVVILKAREYILSLKAKVSEYQQAPLVAKNAGQRLSLQL